MNVENEINNFEEKTIHANNEELLSQIVQNVHDELEQVAKEIPPENIENHLDSQIVTTECSVLNSQQNSKGSLGFNDSFTQLNKELPLILENDQQALSNRISLKKEMSREVLKKKVYSQAKFINKTCAATPKIQRLNENVSKVFGMGDPPPGFGNTYPNYYFLEQNLTKPITPLKVWRGFNGNIYFEPMHMNQLNRSITRVKSSSVRLAPMHKYQTQQETSAAVAASEPVTVPHHRIRGDLSIQLTIRDSKQIRESNQVIDEFVFIKEDLEEDNSVKSPLNKHRIVLGEKNQEDQQAHKVFDQKIDNMSLNSSSVTPKQKMSKFETIAHPVTYLTNTSNNNNNINKDRDYYNMNPANSKSYDERFVSSAINRSNSDSGRRIMPNLNAVKRPNIPLKGLAFKEAHHRIVLSNNNPFRNIENNLVNENNYSLHPEQGYQQQNQLYSTNTNNVSHQSNIVMNIFELTQPSTRPLTSTRLQVSQHTVSNVISNVNTLNSLSMAKLPGKQQYKEMMRGLKKGIVLNMYQEILASLSKDSQSVMIFNEDGKAKTSNKAKSTKKISSLNIKGDRIENQTNVPTTSIQQKPKTSPLNSPNLESGVNNRIANVNNSSKSPLRIYSNKENRKKRPEKEIFDIGINLNNKMTHRLFNSSFQSDSSSPEPRTPYSEHNVTRIQSEKKYTTPDSEVMLALNNMI